MRPILLDFVNNIREKMIEQGFAGSAALESDIAARERCPLPSCWRQSLLFYQLSGRVPQ
ncbi:MAG: hypothetical protein ACR65T_05195 [Methylocystis sp.]|uniref:hypothetical protein n=1 Tax=Methylocystis sp. TaxID=1911079 RepID=UPI003DA26E6D